MGDIRAYVDECKGSKYLMALVICDSYEAPGFRRKLEALRMPRQRRIHMRKEGARRQAEIRKKVEAMSLNSFIVTSDQKSQPMARRECLTEVARICQANNVIELIIEADASYESDDNKTLARLIRDGAIDFQFRHSIPQTEPMLWAADVLAWIANKTSR